jgi:hypothetical protein
VRVAFFAFPPVNFRHEGISLVNARPDFTRNPMQSFRLSPIADAVRSLIRDRPAAPAPRAPRKRAAAKRVRFEPIEPRLLMDADPIVGAIDSPGEEDRYGFTLETDTQLVFDSLSQSPGINWTLSGPNGTVVSSRAFDASDGAQFGGAPLLDLRAGDYVLTVDGESDATGQYGFRLIEVAETPLINPGTAVSGELSPASGTNAYRFNATAGEKFFFDVTSQTGAASWRLIGPRGAEVFSQGSLSDVEPVAAPYTGVYTLLIEGAAGATGTASYAFNLIGVTDQSPTLSMNTLTSGTIAQPGQRYVYSFDVETFRRVYFDSLTATQGLTWSLKGPRGTVVESRAFSASDGAAFSGPAALDLTAGEYELVVDGAGAFTGDFSFQLLDLADATAITPGTPVSGDLTPAASTRLYRFDAVAGARFDFSALSLTGPAAAWRLIGPDGDTVFGGQGFDGTLRRLLTRSGTYTLALEGAVGSVGTSSYSFNLLPNGSATLPEGPELVTGTPGTTYQGQLSLVPLQPDFYQFTLTEANRSCSMV